MARLRHATRFDRSLSRRRFLGTSAAALAGLGALSATSLPVSADQTTLKFQSWESATEAKLERKVIDAFEARNPSVKIDFSTAPWTPYWTKMQTAAASG